MSQGEDDGHSKRHQHTLAPSYCKGAPWFLCGRWKVWQNFFSLHMSCTHFRKIPFVTVARFQHLGDDGFEFLKGSLGILHADICERTIPLLEKKKLLPFISILKGRMSEGNSTFQTGDGMTWMAAVSLVILFGYTLLGMINLHTNKGWSSSPNLWRRLPIKETFSGPTLRRMGASAYPPP